MKKLLLTALLAMFFWVVAAQNPAVTPDPRLYDVFSTEEINNWMTTNPNQIVFYNVVLDHAYYVDTYPAEKMDFINELPVLTLKSQFRGQDEDFSQEGLDELNILKYDFQMLNGHISIYRLGNTSKIVVFIPEEELQSVYTEALK